VTAQPVEPAARGPWGPDPLRQRLANYTIEDVLALPDDAPRVELRDGVIIVVPSPTFGHQTIASLLWMWLRQHAPLDLAPVTAVGVAISHRNTLEPDVLLLRQPVVSGSHYFDPEQVALVVEVVSPGTRRRDRLEKPADYAAAGIPHYWRVEQDPLHVYAYDLVGDAYELAADATEELVLAKPFEIRLRVRDIAP
jgi:Uma2 family endonuclease